MIKKNKRTHRSSREKGERMLCMRRSILERIRTEARERIHANRELIPEHWEQNLWIDPMTRETFMMFPIVLTEKDFVVSRNTAFSETIISSYTVPNTVILLFRTLMVDISGAFLDRSAPYIHGSLKTANNTNVSGTVRIKVMDKAKNDIKGQPFTGNASELNCTHAFDWNQRLFFNCPKPV